MRLKTAKTVSWIIFGAIVIAALALIFTQSKVCFWILMVLLAAFLVINIGFIRCPHCGMPLDRTAFFSDTRYCPFCGKELYQDE